MAGITDAAPRKRRRAKKNWLSNKTATNGDARLRRLMDVIEVMRMTLLPPMRSLSHPPRIWVTQKPK